LGKNLKKAKKQAFMAQKGHKSGKRRGNLMNSRPLSPGVDMKNVGIGA